jgi:hypothetical protein
MVAGFKSESRPASIRNTWPECVGICNLSRHDCSFLPLPWQYDSQTIELRRLTWGKLVLLELSQTTDESVKTISDAVSEWRKAGHPV